MPSGLVKLPDGRVVARGSKAERDYWKKTHNPDGTAKPGPNSPTGKAKPKPPPLVIPSLTIDYENPPPKPRKLTPVGPVPKGPKQKHGGHVPDKYLEMGPADYAAWLLGVQSKEEHQRVVQKNQWREKRLRSEAADRRASEKAAREERRAAVRGLTQKQRQFIGRDKLNHWITTGEGMEPSFGDQLEAGIKGGAKKLYEYGKGAVRHPSQLPTDIYDAGDWWINTAPEKVFGKDKGPGRHYEGGAVEAWDKMSGEEQLDTILGGKSFTNALLHGDLDPANIGRAIALAAMAPIPFGKGLPSLATVLLRAGMSVEEVKIALTTGKGLKEGLEAAKTPVLTRAARRNRIPGQVTAAQLERNLHAAEAAHAAEPSAVTQAARREAQAAVRAAGGKVTKGEVRWPEPRRVRALKPEDADVIESWGGERARRGFTVLSDAKKNRGPTVALTDEAGKLRAVAGFAVQGEDLVVTHLASEGKGGGIAMMRELATEADALGLGMKLVTNDADARAFYTKLGMHPQGEHGFSWSPEEVAEFADTPLPEPPAETHRLLSPEEAETLTPTPGKWYHGTTEENAAQIMDSGVLKVGTRSEPNGAWLSNDPKHAAFHGKAVIEIPDSYIPAEAERISAFGGMVSSPVDIPLRAPDPMKAVADDIATRIFASGLHLPPELSTHEQLAAGIQEVFKLAEAGEFGKDWYQEAADGVMLVAEEIAPGGFLPHGVTPKEVAQLFAIYSQAADTIANASFVFSAIDEFQKYGDIFSGRFPVRQSEEAMKVLRGEAWEGRKRSSFYANMLRHIPGMEDEYADVIAAMAAERGAEIAHPVTVDRWVVRMFRPGSKKDVPEKYYDTFETIMQQMAKVKGWEPEQIQAAAWVAKKQEGLDAEIAKNGGKIKGTLKARIEAGAGDAFGHGIQRQIEKRRAREAAGQLFDTKELEVTPQMKRLANQANKKWGGFTVDRDLNPVPEVGYSVTVSITETPYRLHSLKGADIAKFRDRWAEMLKDKRYKIGGFSDDANEHGDGTEITYLSLTRHFKRKADAMKYAREQGQETVYEYATGNGIRTGLTRDEQAAIIERLRDEAGDTARGINLPERVVLSTPEQEYKDYLDGLVRASGKGKRGVTQKQRDAMAEEMIKYGNRYHDDPYFDEFWRLHAAVNHVGAAEDIPWGEAGFLDLAALRREAHSPRTIRVGQRDVQLHGTHNRVTRALLERPVDWTSAKLASEESRAAAEIRKALGKVGLHPGARERGVKQLGMRQVKAASRRQARMMNYEQALPKYGSPADVAHFYWAQLPPDLRNLDGLQLVVDDLAREAEEITSGRMLESINAQIDAVNAGMRNEDGSTNLAMLRDLEDLKLLADDLPSRLKDIAIKTAELQKTIKKAPKYDPKVIDAMRGLSEQREKILTRAGILKPERAAGRKGLYARHLGVPESGEEVYVGHRMGKVKGAQSSLMPASPGVGRPMTPQGARSKNNLVLMRTGRVRASTHVAAEDWRAAETYDAALLARDDLFSMGYKFTGRVPEGHVLINADGHAIPRHWKELPDLESLSDDEVKKIAEEVVQGFKAESPAEIDAMLEEAAKMGPGWEKRLRTIPKKDVDRYYGRFTPARGGGAVGKAYDSAVDFMAASLIFARVGYIPKNIAQNLIMAVPHQGPFLLMNVPRAAEVLIDPELRHLLHAEVGFSGKTAGIGEELRYGQKFKGIPSKVAGMMGKVADDPMRMSAFLHEAAKKGVISKFSPHLTPKDKEALLKLLRSEDPKDIALLNDIADNAVGAMADFSRLSPTQRRTARRFLIIPGWLWAGTRLPVDFALNYPVRTAAIGYALAGEPYGDRIGLPQNDPIWDYMEKGVPNWATGIHLPDSFPIFGGKTLRTGSISPVNTPYEIALALGGQSEDTPAAYANPLAKAVWNIANRQVSYPGGTYQTGYQESIIRNLQRLLPNWTFVKQEIHPSGDGFYPEDESRLGRFFRELGVVPIKVVGEEKKDTDEWVKEAETVNGGPLPKSVPGRVAPLDARKAYVANQEAEKEFNDENGIEQGDAHTAQERLIILIRTLVKLHPEKAAAAKDWEEQARGLSDDAAQAEIDKGRKGLGLTDYDYYQDKIGEAKLNARTHTGMVNGGQHG